MNTGNFKIGNKVKWLLSMTAGAAMLALAAGCQPEKTDITMHGEEFLPIDSERAPSEFVARQSANATRSDGTLRAYHFNHHDLNSLGEERLNAMLYWRESTAPLVVYIDLPADDAKTTGRRENVIAYLKDHHLTEDQIEFKSGPNPDYNSPVAPILAAQQGGGAKPPGADAAGPGAAH